MPQALRQIHEESVRFGSERLLRGQGSLHTIGVVSGFEQIQEHLPARVGHLRGVHFGGGEARNDFEALTRHFQAAHQMSHPGSSGNRAEVQLYATLGSLGHAQTQDHHIATQARSPRGIHHDERLRAGLVEKRLGLGNLNQGILDGRTNPGYSLGVYTNHRQGLQWLIQGVVQAQADYPLNLGAGNHQGLVASQRCFRAVDLVETHQGGRARGRYRPDRFGVAVLREELGDLFIELPQFTAQFETRQNFSSHLGETRPAAT